MKIKVETQGFRVGAKKEFDAKLNEKIEIARFGGLFGRKLQFAMTPLKISAEGMEFKASGFYSKFSVMKVNNLNKEKYEIKDCFSKNRIYSIKRGEQLKFLGKKTEAKDFGNVYVLTIE